MEAAAPRRVLVVDDDPDIRSLISEMLSATGYEVSTAQHGREALELLRAQPFGLVVLDLMMPVMTGWEFREAQLRDPEIAGVPVVVVSAARSPRPVPAAAFLAKPFDVDELLALTARLVS
ncbi:MAG TPA: response regulator [Anaeromyxobacteraceae bacterium]|nr:response regulator [Anaeromyxobacteraceae bacterium]